jgi:anaerobic selenocysteine-containing dehydrogenase
LDTTAAVAEAESGAATVHYRTCPLCEATCGLEITMVGDAVKRIRGDRDDVFSRGFICPKGSTLKQIQEDPDRLRTPLVRRDGELVDATWDEAWAVVAEGLSRVRAAGEPNAVAVYLGNPNSHTLAGGLYARPLLKSLGTRNVFSASTVDQMPKHVSSGLLFGNPSAIPIPDLDRTDYLLMLGANPFESNGSLCTAPDFPGRLAAIRERGGRVVVVDPRRTRTADAADEHLAIRPGTDALWLAALANEILATGKADLGAVAPLVDGLDRLPVVLRGFTAEAVARRTRIAPEVTRRIASELAGASSAAVYGRIGTHTVRFGTVASWLVDVLNLITANLDRPGGAMFPSPAHDRHPDGRAPGGRGFRTGRWTSRISDRPEVRGELPAGVLAEEIETPGPDRIRALVTVAGNPVRSIQESERLDAALASLEFMVSIDIYVNETTRHADVILPPPAPLEKAHYDLAFTGLSVRNIVNYSPAIIETNGPQEWEIYARLALVAGGADPTTSPSQITELLADGIVAQRRSKVDAGDARDEDPTDAAGGDLEAAIADADGLDGPERLLALMLRTGPYRLRWSDVRSSPHGIDLGPLAPRLAEVLRTTDGRVDLVPAPIAADVERLAESLASDDDGGLLLVGRRDVRSNNSWMHNIEVLVKGRPRCTLQVHPDDAAALDLRDGGTATVSSRVGSLAVPVEVTDIVNPGTVSLPHGWGHGVKGTRMAVAARYAGMNTNALTDASVLDPLSGNAQLNAIPVTVTPCEPGR